jgi:hypothetical protein
LPIAPFELLALEVVRAREVARVRELDGLDELLRARVLPAREFVLFVLVDELFRPVDRVDFEPGRRERVLVDRVVWAIVLASPWLACQLLRSRWRASWLPAE